MDRPTKQLHRSRRSGTINSDHSEGQYPYDVTSDLIDPPITATADTAEWQDTIERVVRNVVSIHFCQTCSFDTSAALSSEATGFVVDKEKGYILTNRHVVGSGPFWGYCIFDNHEEVCKNAGNTQL
jgi:S1-C subfamily serine protease